MNSISDPKAAGPGRKELRKFGVVFGCFFALVFGLLLPWRLKAGYPAWPWAVAAVSWSWAAFAPGTMLPFYRTWMRVGAFLGRVNTFIILTVFFYAVITPFSIIMRLYGRDTMARKTGPDIKTYRVACTNRSYEKMERPF